MATKLNAVTAKRVKALSINAKTEEEVRERILEILVENGIEGMEDEELDTLMDIAESFVDEDSSDDDNEASEEDENDELAQEVEEEEDEEVEEEEDEEVGDVFTGMDRTELKKYIKDNKFEITVKKSMSDNDIREAIRAEVEELVTKKIEKTDVAKKEEKKPVVKTEKKADKKEAKLAVGKRGIKLDPKNNEDDREVFDVFKKLFPTEEYIYAWVASAGVTIKYKGKNSQRSIVTVENCSKQADGFVKCNLYLFTFTKQTEPLDEVNIDYERCWSGAPLIKGITLDEAVEIIIGLMEQITDTVKKIDKKLGDNRKKMEENLDKKSLKSKKVTAKEEEPEEEEVPKPKKVAAPSKKTTKKK